MSSNSIPRSMDKNSKSNFLERLASYEELGVIPLKPAYALKTFYTSYIEALSDGKELPQVEKVFSDYLDRVKEQCEELYQFSHYHKKVRTPFDYYKFGIDFLRPLVNRESSGVLGKQYLDEITEHLKQNHNVIFLANHQTEADPQALSLLLEENYPSLSESVIFVAGERVVTDPVAIPFSLGCDLLCIYSKRYIDHPPEDKHQKQLHNKKTMQLMSDLLKEGGKCIYVAPSGGRDRRNAEGEIEIAPFDPKSIEMFYLMAKKSKTPTFFYPMALGTYALLPPPETIQVELGEKRSISRVGIHVAVGPQIDMKHYPNSDHSNKDVRRKSRSDYIWELVQKDYRRFQGGSP